MTQSSLLNRRNVLIGSATLAIGTAVGCRQQSEPAVQAKPEREDVPLRLALVSARGESDAESLRRGWSAVTEQPLDIQSVALNRAEAAAVATAVHGAAQKCDVVVYPLALVADLALSRAIVALADSEFEEIDEESGPLFPSLRNGAARFAGEYFALPLGASLPALLSRGDLDSDNKDDGDTAIPSWEDYDTVVEQSWDGMAAEPSAPGWAGAMFLWRAAKSKSWLFGREDLEPLVHTEPYVESLELMVRTNDRYKSKRLMPEQVWSGVKSGELKGGIGYPDGNVDSGDGVQIHQPPGVTPMSRVLLDPFSPVISLSANCRQSRAAKRFIGWIGGGEARDMLRTQVSGVTVVRNTGVPTGNDSGQADNYAQWLAGRLRTPLTIPTLQILRGAEYYAVLDQQIGRALEGDAIPKEALEEVATQWRAITKEVGVEKQLRAWQRAQGMRS